MKIGYVMQLGVDIRSHPFSGQANHVRKVVEELSLLGHEVRIIEKLGSVVWKTDNLVDFSPRSAGWLERNPFRLFESSVRRVQHDLKLPYLALFESLRFASICQIELAGYDLAYERFSWMGYGGSLAAGRLKIPHVIEDNGDHLADLESKGIAPHGLQRRLSLRLMGRAVRRASHIVSTGDGWRAQFTNRWGISSQRVTTVENGSELVKLLKREQLRSFCSAANPGSIVSLVYVGGFDPWHGISVLLHAILKARNAGAPVQLVLIGSGIGLEEAKQLATDLGLTDAVRFTGQLSHQEFAPILAGADIGVSPYCGWKEYSGLKLFDYKAAGLATIASGENGQPATLKHQKTAWIVPPCDEDALADAILRLSANGELRRQIGRDARAEAEKLHGWDHTARQLEHIFYSVLKQ